MIKSFNWIFSSWEKKEFRLKFENMKWD